MVWKSLIEWARANHFDLYASLMPGSEPQQSISIGGYTIDLPADLLEIYRINSGQSREFGGGFLIGMRFMNQEESVDAVNDFFTWCQGDPSLFYEEDGSSIPVGAIRLRYLDYLRYPFALDDCGNYIGLDFDPDYAGQKGQVINFGHDYGERIVLAENISEFVEKIYSDLLNKRALLIKQYNVYGWFSDKGEEIPDIMRHFVDINKV